MGGDESDHSFAIEVSLPQPRWHRKCWMRDCSACLQALALTQICVPGTHNSATSAINRHSRYGCDAPSPVLQAGATGSLSRFFANGIAPHWARCQSLTVADSLAHGVRYFDFRLAPNPKDSNELYISHAMLSVSLTAVVNSVLEFYEDAESADEFLILDFQTIFLHSDEELEKFFYAKLEALKERCLPRDVPLSTPLHELWKRSAVERIIVLIGRDTVPAEHPYAFLRKTSLSSPWKNKQKPHQLFDAFNNELREKCLFEDSSPPNALNVAQAILTPTSNEIVRGAFFPWLLGVRALARSTNSKALQWFYRWNTTACIDGEKLPVVQGLYRNIIIIDFVQHGHANVDYYDEERKLDLVELCVFLNQERNRRGF